MNPTQPCSSIPAEGWTALAADASQAIPLYDVDTLRHIENAAFARLPSFELMSRAGGAAAGWLAQHAPQGLLLFLAGPGNNGGDALVAATRLHQTGRDVQVWLTADSTRMPADAARAWQEANAAGVPMQALPATAPWPDGTTAIVDGLLGIGLNRPAGGTIAAWIERLAQAPAPVFALDIPSGLFADTGAGDPAVRACRTLTFIGAKPGLLTLDGRDCAGSVDIAPLGLDYPPSQAPRAWVNGPALFRHALPARRHAVNKGTFGSLAILGGNTGMTGAPLLGARAAQCLGAGKVHIGFLAPSAPAIDPLHPELMLHPQSELALGAMSTLVIGPGMGSDTGARKALAQWLEDAGRCTSPPSLVLDADALNLLAADASLAATLAASGLPRIMTPHPLEAARLLGTSVAAVQRDRLAAAEALAAQWQAVVVLKGSGTAIAAPGTSAMAINPTGNAALASAGTGDVLAGMAGALLAQGMPLLHAAQAAVWIHGRAADRMVANGAGPAGLTASELYLPARSILNALLRGEAA